MLERDLSAVARPLNLADIDTGWKNTKLLHDKISACVRMYDWTVIGSGQDSPHRHEKREILLELVQFCKSKNDAFQHPLTLPILVRMIAANLFRALPPRDELPGEDDDEDEPYTNPNWPEMSVTYELLLQIVLTDKVDTKAKKVAFDPKFVVQLLELFDSADTREREYLKVPTGTDAVSLSSHHRTHTHANAFAYLSSTCCTQNNMTTRKKSLFCASSFAESLYK